MIQKIKNNQSGRTIMEMIAYIMIMVVLTAAVAVMAQNGYHRYECSMIQQELMDLKKLIVMRYAADGNYANIKWADLRESNMGPRSIMPTHECKTDNCYGQHTFEGKIKIGPGDEYGETFYITFYDLPSDVCAQLGSKLWVFTDGSDVERVEINGTIWTLESLKEKADAEYVLPTQTKDVVAACQEGYGNYIRWDFN